MNSDFVSNSEAWCSMLLFCKIRKNVETVMKPLFFFYYFLHLSLRNKHFIIVILHKSLLPLVTKGSRDVARMLSKAARCTLNSQNIFNFASSRGKFLVKFRNAWFYRQSWKDQFIFHETLSRANNHPLLSCLAQFDSKLRESRSYSNCLKFKLSVFLESPWNCCTEPA